MWRLWILLPLLVLTSCQKTAGAVRLTVSYTGFKPGCVRVIARDDSGAGEPGTTELAGTGDATGGSLTVAIFLGEGWGSKLHVEAQSFESPCPASETGTPVSSDSQTVSVEPGKPTPLTLSLEARDEDMDGYVSLLDHGSDCDDSDGTRHPGAPELCDTRDNDCDGETNEGLGLGDACTNEGNCMGTLQCALDGGVTCSAQPPTIARYPDGDTDGYGARDAGASLFCTPPSSGYAVFNSDCADDDPLRHPQAPERCNGLDDNCDDTPDDGLNVGAACTPAAGCTGERACESDGGVSCRTVTFPTLQYPDDDRDTYGTLDAGPVSSCTPVAGHAPRTGDCDDGNPFTHPDARELCDALDNDCNGGSEGTDACPAGGPAWTSTTVGVNTELWRSVALWGDGGVWIVGTANRRAVKQPGATSFGAVQTLNCDGSWQSVWADPMTGKAFFSSDTGKLVYQDPQATGCTNPVSVSNLLGSAIFGLPGQGGVDLHGGGTNNSSTNLGKTYIWDGNAQLRTGTAPVAPLTDIHGLSRGVLFASGGYSDSPRMYRFNTTTSDWQSELVQDTSSATSLLEAVWVVDDHLAWSVGWKGSVLRWDGTRWNDVAFPGTDDLSGVVAFGRTSVYATSRSGKVFRYNGTTWQQVASHPGGGQFYDIAATSPEDIWVVGSAGVVMHWPQ